MDLSHERPECSKGAGRLEKDEARPYIVELLTDTAVPGPDDFDEKLGCWCERYGQGSRQAVLGVFPTASHVILGSTQRSGGRTRTRALIFCPPHDVEQVIADGENLAILTPSGEIFCTSDRIFHVTDRDAFRIKGSFAYGLFASRDGEEVGQDLRAFLLPRILQRIERRVTQLIADPTLLDRHATLLRSRAMALLEDVELSALDNEMIDTVAMRVLYAARVILRRKEKTIQKQDNQVASRPDQTSGRNQNE